VKPELLVARLRPAWLTPRPATRGPLAIKGGQGLVHGVPPGAPVVKRVVVLAAVQLNWSTGTGGICAGGNASPLNSYSAKPAFVVAPGGIVAPVPVTSTRPSGLLASDTVGGPDGGG